MELKEFIGQMDSHHKSSAITRIADACNVSRNTVYRWIDRGIINKNLYKRLINEEFKQEIFKL